jgi:hypothetical protein
LLVRFQYSTEHVIGAEREPDERKWWEKISSRRQVCVGQVMGVHVLPVGSEVRLVDSG